MSQNNPKVDYSKSLIYKLVSKDTNIKNVYIGSTTNFRKRKNSHKSSCNNEKDKLYNLYVYKFIRENGGFENWSMILIDYTPCNTKLELAKIEREYIEKVYYELLLNKQLPSRTKEEWGEVNKEILKEKRKIYLETNKEHIKQKKKEYREENNEQIKQKKSEKITCNICNSLIRRDNLKKHQQRKKCLSCR